MQSKQYTAQGAHLVTAMFEEALCEYTGAPFCVAVDSGASAMELALIYEDVIGEKILVPKHTYMSVPCAVKHAGACVVFMDSDPMLTGEYRLVPTKVWDSALRFTANMYRPGQFQCLSFTGPNKALKLGKGGAILTDNEEAYNWFKKYRNSGRSECSYHTDNFTMLGRNCYLLPMIAAQGLLLIRQFYNMDGTKKDLPDISLPYPDLSQFPIYTT